MFCADYIAAFVYHAIITVGTIHFFDRFYNQPADDNSFNGNTNPDINKTKINAIEYAAKGLGLSCKLDANKELDLISENDCAIAKTVEKSTSLLLPFCVGITSGFAASATLYPFDFVRSGVLKPGLKRLLSAGSTIPYAGALYGIYFSFRDPNNTPSQVKWAGAASTCAILAEVPFDHAKRSMLGSTRVMLGAGLLYVPFASIMLVMYDKAAIKLVSPIIYKS